MLKRAIVFSLFLLLVGGCAKTYRIENFKPAALGVMKMNVPATLKTKVLYTRLDDCVLTELPKSKIDTAGTVGGIAAKKLFSVCGDASKCEVFAEDGLPTNTSMVREGELIKGAAFETDLGYIWLKYFHAVPLEKALSDILLVQMSYKTAAKASTASFMTRYGAIEPNDETTYWQTMLEGKNGSGSQTLTVYYASESSNSREERIDPRLGSFSYILYRHLAEYSRKRTVGGLPGTEWMVEKSQPTRTRYQQWFYAGEVPGGGKVRIDISLEAPLSMDEDRQEAIWNFILNSVRLPGLSQ
ncbi:hypothetical protein [Pseudodesulfovibrio sp.]|uniref:hypothetical protein n=1 Tax=unclassified Pseudodesulfovibrio TaxID=2661612 RepID=UPI003B00F8DA